MLKILAYKKYCTSTFLDNKIRLITICKSGTISVLFYKKFDTYIESILGFFDVQKINKLNRSILNGMYQKDRKDKKQKFRTCRLEINEHNQPLINKLYNCYTNKTNMNIHDFLDNVDSCAISGFMKGRGYAGVIKRHGFAGLGKAHGVTLKHRAFGSTGSRNPNHTVKGQKMAGRYRNKIFIANVKILKNTQLLEIDKDVIAFVGDVPGHENSLIEIQIRKQNN